MATMPSSTDRWSRHGAAGVDDMISLVMLVGAEFNAMLFPRAMLEKELTAINGHKAAKRRRKTKYP